MSWEFQDGAIKMVFISLLVEVSSLAFPPEPSAEGPLTTLEKSKELKKAYEDSRANSPKWIEAVTSTLQGKDRPTAFRLHDRQVEIRRLHCLGNQFRESNCVVRSYLKPLRVFYV